MLIFISQFIQIVLITIVLDKCLFENPMLRFFGGLSDNNLMNYIIKIIKYSIVFTLFYNLSYVAGLFGFVAIAIYRTLILLGFLVTLRMLYVMYKE